MSPSNSGIQLSYGWCWSRWPVQGLLSGTNEVPQVLQIHILVFLWDLYPELFHPSSLFTLHWTQSYLEYRIELAQQLIGNYCSRKRPGRQPSTLAPAPKRISVEYFPAKTTKGRCSYCKDRRTSWHRNHCDKRLCHTGLRDRLLPYLPHNAWSYVTHRASLM